MTGWRIGYGAGPAALVKAITLLIGQSTTCATSAAQAAAVEALNGPRQCVSDAARLFEERRDRMVDRLNAIEGITCETPDGAFYVFASVAGLIGSRTPNGQVLVNDVDVADFLREEAGVVAIDGSSYGMSPFLRISFATSMTEIERGCAAIGSAVSLLERTKP
jgi:aspartate aminotransferase